MDAVEQAQSYEDIMAYAGYVLRDADLDDIAHFFAYSADEVAQHFLGSPDPDEGESLSRAA